GGAGLLPRGSTKAVTALPVSSTRRPMFCANLGEAHLELGSREAIGNAVEMALDIDVIIDANPAHAPFGEDIRLDRQRLERRWVEARGESSGLVETPSLP